MPNVPFQLLPIHQWPHGNSCTWAHDVQFIRLLMVGKLPVIVVIISQVTIINFSQTYIAEISAGCFIHIFSSIASLRIVFSSCIQQNLHLA